MTNFHDNRTAARDELTPKAAIELARAGGLCLVDVRDISELRMSGKARGAVHIPLMLLMSKADPRSPECDPALDMTKPVGIYCATGARANIAVQMMAQMGYQTIYNLGGLANWQAAGGDIERV